MHRRMNCGIFSIELDKPFVLVRVHVVGTAATYGLIITIPIANAILVALLGLIQNLEEGARDSLSPKGLLLQFKCFFLLLAFFSLVASVSSVREVGGTTRVIAGTI